MRRLCVVSIFEERASLISDPPGEAITNFFRFDKILLGQVTKALIHRCRSIVREFVGNLARGEKEFISLSKHLQKFNVGPIFSPRHLLHKSAQHVLHHSVYIISTTRVNWSTRINTSARNIHANDCRDRVRITKHPNGPEGPAVVRRTMLAQPHDRARKYDAGPQRTAESPDDYPDGRDTPTAQTIGMDTWLRTTPHPHHVLPWARDTRAGGVA